MTDNSIYEGVKDLKLPLNFTFILGIIYFFGFIVTNSYLSTFNFYSIDLLNTQYLVSGIIFSGFFGILIISVYFSNKQQDKISDKPEDFLLPVILRILIISYVISLFTINYVEFGSIKSKILNIISFTFLVFGSILNSNYIIKKMDLYIRWGLMILYILLATSYVFYFSQSSRIIILLCVTVGFGFSYFLQKFIDKSLLKVQVIGLILVFISIAVLFGSTVYKNISRKIGGGKPYTTTLVLNSDKINNIKEIIDFDSNSTFKVEMIFETKRDFLFIKDSTIYRIDKSFFIGEINIRKSEKE